MRETSRYRVQVFTAILFLTVVFHAASHAQPSFYISGNEFHWSRGAVPPVIQPKVAAQLSSGSFRIAEDSSSADFTIRIKCFSYYSHQTPYFYFGLLDANIRILDKKKSVTVYEKDIKKIKGGGTTVYLADDKVYANASQILADTVTRIMYMYTYGRPGPEPPKPKEFEVLCDADTDIPVSGIRRPNTYVLIVANDTYSPIQMAKCGADSADFHARDARVFREYAIRTLGIPPENIGTLFNAKSFTMRREMIKLASYSRGIEGNAELLVYYSGLGLLDDKTLEPYILPVDVESEDPKFIIRISDLYKMLQEDPSKKVTVILETSFQFDALKPKPASAKSGKIALRYPNVPANFILLAAAKPGHKAWSDNTAGHSQFTLSLLKKLKSSVGHATIKEISDFIQKDVKSATVQMKLPDQAPVSLFGSSLVKDLPVLKL